MMNRTRNITAVLTTLLAAASAQAATVTAITPRPAEGVPYDQSVVLGAQDSGSFSRHVGAWSWEDNALFGGEGQGTEPVGWTHTSNWVQLTLTSDTTFTVTMSRDANVAWPSAGDPARLASTASMFPSLTLYAGWDTDGEQSHTYQNREAAVYADAFWAEDLTFLALINKSTETSITGTWTLPAGQYTLALGSNAPATDTNRQGYQAVFSTVPEPGAVSLLAVAALALPRRRRAC